MALDRTPGAWTDSGQANEDRQLKHRSRKSTRHFPPVRNSSTPSRHIDTHPAGPDGRLFVTRIGPAGVPLPPPFTKPVRMGTVYRVWDSARAAALTPAEYDSPPARRPYDLRHAAVSLWLNAGVPPTQVADWAGHSVSALLKVYAKSVVGQDEVSRDRITTALGQHPPAARKPETSGRIPGEQP